MRINRTVNTIATVFFKGGGQSGTNLDLRGPGAAEALLHLRLEVSGQQQTAVQHGEAGGALQAGVVLSSGVHGGVAHDVLLQGGRRGEHLVHVRRACEEEGGRDGWG